MIRIARMGWRPDLPDHRDFTAANPALPPAFTALLGQVKLLGADEVSVDLRGSSPPVKDQGDLGSCTANGTLAIHEILDRKTFGRHTDLARLFLYKATRNWMGVRGDTGAEIRNAMGALALFGAPPEDSYPYEATRFDDEPSAYHYALASNFKGVQYARLDKEATANGGSVIDALTSALLKGWPWVFGFTCYSSLDDTGADGRIAFPSTRERVTGGHCVTAVGFDTEQQCPGQAGKGAFLIRNSWGASWGDQGYGWLPFEYFTQGLAEDCWTLTKAAWVDTEPFK